MLKVFFLNNFQNIGKITVITGSSHLGVLKKVEKLQIDMQEIILVKI